MPTYLDLIKQREDFSEKSQSALLQHVKALQGALYSALLDRVISSLEVDETGGIKFSIGNMRTANKVSFIWQAHQRNTNQLTKWIVRQIVKLFDLNTQYAKAITNVNQSLELRSRKLLLFNLGYDIEAGKIVPDSWLSNLAAQDEIKARVVNRINTAIQAKMGLKEFRTSFRDDFLDTKTGLGYMERYFEGRTFDLFQKFDRATQMVYANELKLKWQIYTGTIMEPVKGKTKGTRPFCRQRVGNIYSREEIEKWRNLEFSGKSEPYNPLLDCGGFNCRHAWNVISDELKETLEKRGRKVNEYNPLPAGQTLTKY